MDKTLLESREVARPKKVCFSESSLTSGDRTRRSYYLNGRQGGPGASGAASEAGVWGAPRSCGRHHGGAASDIGAAPGPEPGGRALGDLGDLGAPSEAGPPASPATPGRRRGRQGLRSQPGPRRPLSSSQVRPLVGWGLRDKEGLPDPGPGEGTRKTILAVKEARQCFRPSRRDREGLNIPGVPGDSPRKGRRGKVPFGLRQEARFSFKAVFVYVGPEGGVPLHWIKARPLGGPRPQPQGLCPPRRLQQLGQTRRRVLERGRRRAVAPGCASGARPVSLSATPQRSRASPAPRRTGASWARSPSSWTGASWPTSSPG